MAEWRQTLRRFGHWLTSRKRALPAIKFLETRLPEAKRDWSIRETIIDVSRDVRTRNPLSATAIISGTLPTHTKQDDRMSNDLLSNYNSSVFTNAKSENARTEIYLDGAQFVIVVILGLGNAKSFEVIAREDIKNSVDSTVTFSAPLRFIFNAPFVCQQFEKYFHIFLLSHNVYRRKWTQVLLLNGVK